jgi:hypothetical protein
MAYVRFAPKADKKHVVSVCLLSANSGPEQTQQLGRRGRRAGLCVV